MKKRKVYRLYVSRAAFQLVMKKAKSEGRTQVKMLDLLLGLAQ